MNKNASKRGRPKKDAKDKRSEVLYLKLTPEEKELINHAAPEPAVWARELILKAARRKRKN